MTLDWMRASAAGAGDGQVSLTVGGKRALRATDLGNASHVVKTVVLGLPSGSDGAGFGSLLFDNYTSTP